MCRPALPHLRPLARLLAFAAFAIAAFSTAPASGQSTTGAAAPPLTTRWLHRHLRLHVVPTDTEAAAIDRLHDAYLSRYFAEFDPEISSLPWDFRGHMPGYESIVDCWSVPVMPRFEDRFRDLDRVRAKIAAADDAFLAEATMLLAEERRAGMSRVRDAHARHRVLSGLPGMGSVVFGGGGQFVDLADLLSRDEVVAQVPAPKRGEFDALLRAEEQRVLAQARVFGAEIRTAFESVYAIVADSAQEGSKIDFNNARESERAQRELQQRARERMESVRKRAIELVRRNYEANQAALRRFEAVLPARTCLKLRSELASRSMSAGGIESVLRISHDGMIDAEAPLGSARLNVVVERIRRDPATSAALRSEHDAIELAWLRERAETAERLARLVGGPDDIRLTLRPGDLKTFSKVEAVVRKSIEAAVATEQRAYRALAAAMGPERSSSVLRPGESWREDGKGNQVKTEFLVLGETDRAGKPRLDEPVAGAVPLTGAMPLRRDTPPYSAAEIMRVLQPLGVSEATQAVIEGVVEDWIVQSWDAKVQPLIAKLDEALAERQAPLEIPIFQQGVDDGVDAEIDAEIAEEIDEEIDEELDAHHVELARRDARVAAARREVLDALTQSDAELASGLGAALELAPDSAEMLVLRLERVKWLAVGTDLAIRERVSQLRQIPSPSAILSRAAISPDAARALLESSREDWRKFADALGAALQATVDRSERTDRAYGESQRGPDGGAYGTTLSANAAAEAEFARRYGELCDGSAARLVGHPGVAGAVKRARLSLLRPDLFDPRDSATAQIEQALVLEGVSGGQRARLEALMAEYDARDLAVAEQAVLARMRFDPNDPRPRDTELLRVEAEQKLLFQRNERTEKARSEARRILGDELASRVRGLVPDEAGGADARRANRFDFFTAEDD